MVFYWIHTAIKYAIETQNIQEVVTSFKLNFTDIALALDTYLVRTTTQFK